ncbi:ethanolamine ammonia-lyase reactivating factor EutA [Pseudalkalibacillus sp. SCS-8]|uniref:ethanolamine ammonia-lyase reactivating factor EutA n=1 Tax=Pseudalkalibacillus nanhaiensis TaxID=3115291 RepID=UPI0032D9B65D
MSHGKTEEIMSAGIDIGTSTTKLVISRFTLRNTAGSTHMPRIEITDTEVIHQSPIFRTPLKSGNEIDMDAVERLVLDQYREANVQVDDIQTGAVIITGETATKTNAEEMINHLSDHAGEFLVATAGPDLESIIASRGSGAHARSKRTNKVIANIDIGGGTANVAVHKYGKLLGTCTLHIGGKLIEFKDGKISYMAPAVKKIADRQGVDLELEAPMNEAALKVITDYMAKTIANMLKRDIAPYEPLLLGHQPGWEEDIDIIMFSGGVSECIYHPENCDKTDMYDDIGVLLAESLKESKDLASWEWAEPDETVRATVLGAGTQSTEISGATIQVDDQTLPIKNLPVYRVSFEGDLHAILETLSQQVADGIDIYDPKHEGQNFALYLTELPLLGFKDMQKLAQALLEAVQQKPKQQPLFVVLERDLAKSLGQTLRTINPDQQAVCIDQINIEHGDYLDIGNILQSGVVPVVIKTLTFH